MMFAKLNITNGNGLNVTLENHDKDTQILN
jgi:hypothetical protein